MMFDVSAQNKYLFISVGQSPHLALKWCFLFISACQPVCLRKVNLRESRDRDTSGTRGGDAWHRYTTRSSVGGVVATCCTTFVTGDEWVNESVNTKYWTHHVLKAVGCSQQPRTKRTGRLCFDMIKRLLKQVFWCPPWSDPLLLSEANVGMISKIGSIKEYLLRVCVDTEPNINWLNVLDKNDAWQIFIYEGKKSHGF